MENIHRNKAISLLDHYFKTVFEKAGCGWNSDSDYEMEEIVNCLIDAAVMEIKRTVP